MTIPAEMHVASMSTGGRRIDFTQEELDALHTRLCRPLPYSDPEEAGLPPALRGYRIEENHYRSAVRKIEATAGAEG